MAYRKTEYRCRYGIAVLEYHDNQMRPKGETRRKRHKATPEEIEKANQRNRERKCERELMHNIRDSDYFSTCTYRKDERPADMEEARKDLERLLRRVRQEYRKRGEKLIWFSNIECGTKGAWHVHIILNRITDTDRILADSWGRISRGRVYSVLISQTEGYRKLAAYITKTPKTCPRLREARYSRCRGIEEPPRTDRTYTRWNTWHDIKVPEGYYIDRDSVYEGVSERTGWHFRSYTLLLMQNRRKQCIRRMSTSP